MRSLPYAELANRPLQPTSGAASPIGFEEAASTARG